MSKIQYLRLFSISTALTLGFWLPLRMNGFNIEISIELFLDVLISIAAAVIHAGEVEILTAEGGHIATLKEGAVFGEMALISDSPRTATAKAATYCDLYALPKEKFNHIIDSYPDFKAHMNEVMSNRQSKSKKVTAAKAS